MTLFCLVFVDVMLCVLALKEIYYLSGGKLALHVPGLPLREASCQIFPPSKQQLCLMSMHLS